MCSHCDLEQARRNGLCPPCSAYERKYGNRPSQRVLTRRVRQRQRRHDEVRWVIQLDPALIRELARLYAEDRVA